MGVASLSLKLAENSTARSGFVKFFSHSPIVSAGLFYTDIVAEQGKYPQFRQAPG